MADTYILDKKMLEKRLKELAETPYTGEIQYGAMCYSPACPGDGIYKCETCSNTTTHLHGEWEIEDLANVREIVKSLKDSGYDIMLDEREYCEHCCKRKVSRPLPNLSIRFSNDENYHTVRAEMSDFNYLQAFLQGKDHILDGYDFTVALHDRVCLLVKMTGLGDEEIKEMVNSIKYQSEYVEYLDDYETEQ